MTFRFSIVWTTEADEHGSGRRLFMTDDKLVAQAHLAGILAFEFARGDVPDVQSTSAMEPYQHEDGNLDSFNRVRVRRYFVRSKAGPP